MTCVSNSNDYVIRNQTNVYYCITRQPHFYSFTFRNVLFIYITDEELACSRIRPGRLVLMLSITERIPLHHLCSTWLAEGQCASKAARLCQTTKGWWISNATSSPRIFFKKQSLRAFRIVIVWKHGGKRGGHAEHPDWIRKQILRVSWSSTPSFLQGQDGRDRQLFVKK